MYTIKDLKIWSNKIEEIAKSFGLDFFDIEYQIYSHRDMINAMSYSGIPIHYNHWSFGKTFEIQETYYYYGLIHLPYELVINSNPALAYLMKDNSLLGQIMVMAHVCAHVDFFKNNIHFSETSPELVLETFKNHARRIKSYMEDPSIGEEEVEKWLDAVHSISLNIGNYKQSKLDNYKEIKKKLEKKYFQEFDEYKNNISSIPIKPNLDKIPIKSEPNILLFIKEYRPNIKDWQKDILTIVDREARYFLPQIETKIINEGWASFWHYKILNKLDLPQELMMEFFQLHNRVCTKSVGKINPYYLGLKIWNEIEKKYGTEQLFIIRESMRDVSFISQYLSKELIYELDLFQYRFDRDNSITVEEIADEKGWKKVKNIFLQQVGRNTIPIIKIVDCNYQDSNGLLIEFEDSFDRKLDEEYMRKTLSYIKFLWNKNVYFKYEDKTLLI